MSKSLLITGAAGFIGRYVAEEAARRGYEITGVDRKPGWAGDFESIEADICDRDRMKQLAKSKEYVIHLAAVTSNVEFMRNPLDCYSVNANGFLNVIDAAAHGGCRRFVYASSAAVYLDSFSEDTVMDVTKRGNHYAKTKIMNEMVAKSYEHIHEMKATGLRFFNVYGRGENAKGDYASIVTLFLNFRRNREPLVVYGDGTQARDLINVRDAARITVDLLEKGSHDIYNVGTGVATPYATIAEMLDKDNIRYVPNPLPDYQYYTRAEVTRLREVLGDYEVTGLARGMSDMEEA